jgi:GTPase
MAKVQLKKVLTARLDAAELSAAILRGDDRAAGRVLTLIDNQEPLARDVLKSLYFRTGRACVVGVTGSAGAGKSTLISRMAEELRRRKKQVGILSVDPTSPLTGGALLGDRIRMRDHFLDDGVFIRSLATRGSLGGISSAVVEAAQLLDALGKEYILIETIGIGQDQIDIGSVAQTVLTVITPESGDEVQGIKAGLFEVADFLIINKADLPGVEELFVKFSSAPTFERVPILKISALRGDGIAKLLDRVDARRADFATAANHRQRVMEMSRKQLLALLRDALMARVKKKISEDHIENWVRRIAERRQDPYSAAQAIMAKIGL